MRAKELMRLCELYELKQATSWRKRPGEDSAEALDGPDSILIEKYELLKADDLFALSKLLPELSQKAGFPGL